MEKSQTFILFVKVISNFIFIQRLLGGPFLMKKGTQRCLMFALIGVNYVIEMVLVKQPVVVFSFKILIILFYLIITTKKDLLTLFSIILISFTMTDVLQIMGALSFFPIFKLYEDRITFETACIVSPIISICLAIWVCKLFANKIETLLVSNTKSAKMGICIISGFSEGIFILLKMQEYQKKNEFLYTIMFLSIGFCIIILFFWIWDKIEEQKKMRELSSYAHRTSEVIPTIHRLIKENNLFEDNEKMVMLMQELQSVCESDSREVQQECKSMKTFASTGCMLLDKQLERYLEEARREEFQVDIVVQTPVKQVLNEQMIDLKGLLQVVGDLYKNAREAIKAAKQQQNILICFGCLMENTYQISVYDTGIPFPVKVLKSFGERGITTDGTGNGLADIKKTLENGRASIIVSKDLPEGSIFTKEVRVVFDGMSNIEIK